jgi:signal transduction histidine kinase
MPSSNRNLTARLTKLGETKDISSCMSPLSWMFATIGAFVPVVVILSPSWTEFIFMMLVDYLAFFINKPCEKRLFLFLYPDVGVYFDGIKKDAIGALSPEEKKKMILSLFRFPKRRAIFCYIWSFAKTLPGILVVVFLWKHDSPFWVHVLTVLSIQLVQFWFFFCSVFIESHILVSRMIAEIHEECDVGEIFQSVRIPYSRQEFIFSEAMGFFFTILFVLVLQGVLLTSRQYESNFPIEVKILSISLISLLLLSRLWYLNRTYFMGGLEGIFERMDATNYKNTKGNLPLHSSPLLARFENTFNLLNKRLKVSEQELSSLIFIEAEKSRYRTLGEMSGLIAHDLSGPLHVARFCVSQIEENPEAAISNKKYIEQLAINLDQALGLTTSLRAKLKNPVNRPQSVSIVEAHSHVLRVLTTQFSTELFNQVEIRFDPALDIVELQIQRVDLIHILDNIYKNSFENMICNSVASPYLSIRLDEVKEGKARILIEDNGTGLSKERFEELTAFLFARANQLQREGLGLRLTRRLVELNHGMLSLMENKGNLGTTYQLELPIVQTIARQAIG